MNHDRTRAAISTGDGGAVSIIRVSGADSIDICDKIFLNPNGKKLKDQKGYTIHFGTINDSSGLVIDDFGFSFSKSSVIHRRKYG